VHGTVPISLFTPTAYRPLYFKKNIALKTQTRMRLRAIIQKGLSSGDIAQIKKRQRRVARSFTQ